MSRSDLLETTGPIDGKPLLFLHGCLGGRRLPPQANAALAGRRIIAPGRPGHGQTRSPDQSGFALQGIVADLVALLDHLDIRAVDVLSYDLGAPFALSMAAQVPDRLLSLTCLAPDGFLADAALAAMPWTKGLPRRTPPTTFLVGEEDRNIPRAALIRLADQGGGQRS